MLELFCVGTMWVKVVSTIRYGFSKVILHYKGLNKGNVKWQNFKNANVNISMLMSIFQKFPMSSQNFKPNVQYQHFKSAIVKCQKVKC